MWAVFNSGVFSQPAPGRGRAGGCLEQQTAVSNKTAMGFLPTLPMPDPGKA